MGRVEYVDDGRDWFGYIKSKEPNFHTDHADTVALLCVRQGASGGENRLVSQAALSTIIAEENPAALALLNRGFPYAWFEEAPPEATGPVSHFDVPVLVEHGERVQGGLYPVLHDPGRRSHGPHADQRGGRGLDLVR